MKRNKIHAGLVICLFLNIIALTAIPALGIGVGPAETRIDYEPNLTMDYSITVFNTEKRASAISLRLEGELNSYITIESESVVFAENEEQKTAVFRVSFPRDVPPGVYTGKLLILQAPPEQEGTIQALTGVTHDIILNVPVHGKYIKEYFEATDNELNARIVNIGLKEISTLEVMSLLHDSQNTFKEEFKKEGFAPDDEYLFSISLDKPPGWYEHQIIIKYDELNKTIREQRTIGSIVIDIKSLNFGEFKKGEIVPIVLELESNWNSKLEKVRVEADIIKDDIVVKTIIGADEELQDSKNTTLYLETYDLDAGSYELKARIIYEKNLITERTFAFTVSERELALKKGMKISSYIIAILIIALIMLLTRLYKRKSPPVKKKDLYSKLSKVK